MEQKNIIQKWMLECNKVYNFCVEKYNSDKKYFVKENRCEKIKVFNDMYQKKDKKCPYDMLTDEVRIFFSNLKSCKTNLKNENIKKFKLKPKNTKEYQSVFLPKTCIKETGFYLSHLKNMKGMNKFNFKNKKINDSRLSYDKVNKIYNIHVVYQENTKELKNKFRVVALDPGEKIFQSFYSEYYYGYIGENMRDIILPFEKKIRRYQRIYSNKVNNETNRKYKIKKIKEKNRKGKKQKINKKYNKKHKNKIKNKNKILTKIRKCYKKIKNIIKELHNKTALYLAKNYDRIMLPKFETQNIVKKNKNLKDFFNKIENTEEKKQEIKKIYKKRRLNGRVKFVLNMMSHYKFKELPPI